jgi:hypothetical protein
MVSVVDPSYKPVLTPAGIAITAVGQGRNGTHGTSNSRAFFPYMGIICS